MADDVQLVANTAVLTYAPRSLADRPSSSRSCLMTGTSYLASLAPVCMNYSQRPAEARGENGYLHGGYLAFGVECG